MIKIFHAFSFGLLFGLGLIVAQMTNPAKVLAFLDVAGDWDFSLALVMASALLVLGGVQYFLGLSNQYRQQQECNNAKKVIDAKLIFGSAVFGIGWGLAGICPGPALVNLTSGELGNYVFVAAMSLGFILFKYLDADR